MADHAFALSPMSARAASPIEADFQAIGEAFMETARGRWFLEEFTKRNRNADTAMVLDAVARIERSIAAQRQQQDQTPEPSSQLPEAMAAVRTIIAAARTSAEAALSGTAIDDALAPSRKCARVIREIAWGLRESGADGRICSLLDSQVDAINAACDHASASTLREEILYAFDQATRQIGDLTKGEPPLASPFSAPAQHPAETSCVSEEHGLFEVAATPDAPSTEAMADIISIAEEVPVIEATVASAETIIEPAIAAQAQVVEKTPPEPFAEAVPEPIAAAPLQISLGASLIANGIIAKPASPRSDPLAPIRRMSQAEKIAFFS